MQHLPTNIHRTENWTTTRTLENTWQLRKTDNDPPLLENTTPTHIQTQHPTSPSRSWNRTTTSFASTLRKPSASRLWAPLSTADKNTSELDFFHNSQLSVIPIFLFILFYFFLLAFTSVNTLSLCSRLSMPIYPRHKYKHMHEYTCIQTTTPYIIHPLVLLSFPSPVADL